MAGHEQTVRRIIDLRIYHDDSERYRRYLDARFKDGLNRHISFEFEGHRWRYEFTSFDDQGNYDLLVRFVESDAEEAASIAGGLEQAARWHDAEAERLQHIPGRDTKKKIAHHQISAAAIRALIPSAPDRPQDDLPFRRKDLERGLVLFRTSNNAHGFINFVSLTSRVDALPQVAKDELASLMRSLADGLGKERDNADN